MRRLTIMLTKKLPLRRLARLGLLSAFLLLLALLAGQIVPSIVRQLTDNPRHYGTLAYYTALEAIDDPRTVPYVGFRFDISGFEPTGHVSVPYLLHPPLLDSASCSRTLGVTVYTILSPEITSSMLTSIPLKQLCLNPGEALRVDPATDERVDETYPNPDVPFSVTLPAAMFPFDSYWLKVSATIATSDYFLEGDQVRYPEGHKKQHEVIPTDVSLTVVASDWEETIETMQEDGQTWFFIRLQRHRSLRFLTVALLSSILLFILMILRLQDLGSTVEVTAAILFGIWGIRQVLVPDYVTTTTLVDYALICLYLVLAIVLFARFAVIPLWRRLGGSPDPVSNAESVSTSHDAPESTSEVPFQTDQLVTPSRSDTRPKPTRGKAVTKPRRPR